MIDISKHKPNLIPNNPKDGSFSIEDRNTLIEKNGGLDDYISYFKKDGCRLQFGRKPQAVSRSLEIPQSILVQSRFQELNEACLKLKIAIDGEFYMHGLKFNLIFKYFSNTDVTRPEVRRELEKELEKNPKKFAKKYDGHDIDFITTFHEDLKFWIFDGIVLDRPDLEGYQERMMEIWTRLATLNPKLINLIQGSARLEFTSYRNLQESFYYSLEQGWEGIVMTHKDHKYKFGRNSIKQGTILKIKDENREYDGCIIDIEEGTQSIAGSEKGKNKLGRSTRSQKKEDREPNGMAKGFVVQFEDLGTFTVGLRGFDNEAKRELLENKDKYIGRWFQYSGMPPVKDFPRSVYFDHWRDAK